MPPDELTVHGTARMDKETPHSFLDLPVQVSDDGSVVLTGSKQWDLHHDADGTGWQQGRPTPLRRITMHTSARHFSRNGSPNQQSYHPPRVKLPSAAVSDDDGELDIELDVEEAVRQSSFVTPWDSGGVSAAVAAAAAAVGLRLELQLRRIIGEDFHAERSVDTDVSTHREEPSSPPSPDDASTIGRSYDDVIKTPPPYLRCVVSSLSSQSPILRCTAASLPRFCWSPTFRC